MDSLGAAGVGFGAGSGAGFGVGWQPVAARMAAASVREVMQAGMRFEVDFRFVMVSRVPFLAGA
jgi:hypothetical protein